MRGLLIIALCALLPAALPAAALEQVGWLYDVRVAVADQSQDERRSASIEGLARVLVRVSGDRSLTGDDALRERLNDAERLVSRYSYDSEWVDGARQMFVVLRFSAAAVQNVARQLALPIWSARRPLLTVWIAQADGQPYVLDAESAPAAVSAIEQGGSRAWPRGERGC